jgi:nitrous oxidase accessory protein
MTMAGLILLVVLAPQASAQTSAPASLPVAGQPPAGSLEGRPPAGQASPLQARIDAAAPGSVIDVDPGTYAGDLFIDRPLRLIGHGRPLLIGSGAGSVVRIRADHVWVEGFDVDGRLGGNLARDSSGIHIAGHDDTVRDCRIRRALFGIYLWAADDATVQGNEIDGIRGRDPGEQGSGIHVWNTARFHLLDNHITYSRDGFYIQSSGFGLVARNTVSNVRYGLHYMYSDDNVFEDNVFERSAAGAALMFSRRLVFRRNQFLHNRGFASVGLLMKECEDVIAEDNLVADNVRGFFIEGAYRNVFRRNIVSDSDVALVVYDSSHDNRFEGNLFTGNLTPLLLVGRRTDTIFAGNYWSEADEPDLDGDGVRDGTYRLSNVFDHLRSNLMAADLYAQGLGATVLARAERAFPVLAPVTAVDPRPLAIPPALPDVPRGSSSSGGSDVSGMAASAAGLIVGLSVFHAGRRRKPVARGRHA